MNEIPIFDSLTHPTINGRWIGKKENNNSVENLQIEMTANNVKWAFAVGMNGIGDYSDRIYAEFILTRKNILFPIAYYNFSEKLSRKMIGKKIKNLKEYGYYGIKVHPRFSKLSLDSNELKKVIEICGENDFLVMLCTYFYDTNRESQNNNLDSLVRFLFEAKEAKIILLHGGLARLLDMMEIVHIFKNTLLDLSFTMCRYESSSIDLDIGFLFHKFYNRICIGSDSPEYSLFKLRERFNYFGRGMDKDKLDKVAYKNIMSFSGIGEYHGNV